MVSSSKRLLLVLVALMLGVPGIVLADNLALGTSILPFTSVNACIGGGNACTPGTATGYFEYNPTTNTIASWDFSVTASSDGSFGGVGGAARTYSSSDSGATADMFGSAYSNFGTGLNLAFDFSEANTNTTNVFRIVIECASNLNATSSCLTTSPLQTSYTLITAPPTVDGTGGVYAPVSGETLGPDLAARALSDGFLTVTDPAGLMAFNLSPTSTPPTTNAPEPCTLLLLGSGIAALGAWRRKH